MVTKTVGGFAHFVGTWRNDYKREGDDEPGYELGAEVYGGYEDGQHHHLSCYRSLCDHNTAGVHDETKWLAYCDGEDIAALIDKKIQEASVPLIKERLELTVLVQGETSETGCTVTLVNEETGETIQQKVCGFGHVAVFEIAPDIQYRVKWSGVSGKAAPREKVYHSINNYIRPVTATYNDAPAGVYICTTERALIKAEDWDNQGTVKGIYVSDGVHNFVMAPDSDLNNRQCAKDLTTEATQFLPADQSRKRDASWWGGLDDCTYYKQNCVVGNMPALEYCVNFQWADGVDETSYLPAIAELVFAAANSTAIDEALVACGFTAINIKSNLWWSSSQFAATSAWYLGNGYANGIVRTGKYRARPFSAY